MADINYSKVGWDTTKYVNPTNMNQMDNGIKAACDGVDELTNNLVDVTSGDISTSHTLSEVSYCKKKCGIVNVTINLTTTSQVARYSAVAKIPDGFRPTGYVYLYCGDAKYAIQPNGNVQTLGTIASGTEIVMSTTYICA